MPSSYRWPLLIIPYLALVFLVWFIFVLFFLVISIIDCPYTFFYYSSNWGMLEKDMPHIQLYINHFATLHPDVVSISKSSAAYLNMHWSLLSATTSNFWPNDQSWSSATGFFADLEAAGWSRRVLYEFLRDTVEQSGLVSQLEKEKFAVVMEKMTRHSLVIWYTSTEARYFWFMTGWARRPVKEWGSIGRPLEMQTIQVDMDSVDWLLQGDALLVPKNPRTLNCLKGLGFLPVVEKVEHLNYFRSQQVRWLVMG